MTTAMPAAIPFENVSAEDVAPLWNGCFPDRQLTPDDVSRVLDEHFEPESSFASVDGMKLVGCVLSQFLPEIESDCYWFLESVGVVLAILVHPSHRRQGVGTHLMKLAESRHAERGRTKVILGGAKGLPSLVPGVESGDISARLFLTRLGYHPARTTVEMHAGCSKRPSKNLVEMEAGMLAKGIAIVSADAGDEAEYVRFLRRTARGADPLALAQWEDAPEMTVLARRGLAVIGAANVQERGQDEFILRDICVASEERGKGVGSALLARALRLAGARGARRLTAFAPSGSEAFLGKLGFAHGRKWLSFFKPLRHEEGQRWAERYREAR